MLLFSEIILTRRILSSLTPSKAAKLATKLVEKNADGVIAGRLNVKTINSEIFKSITLAPSITKYANCVVLFEREKK